MWFNYYWYRRYFTVQCDAIYNYFYDGIVLGLFLSSPRKKIQNNLKIKLIRFFYWASNTRCHLSKAPALYCNRQGAVELMQSVGHIFNNYIHLYNLLCTIHTVVLSCSVECADHNFPELFKQNFIGHCIEIARKSVEAPLRKNPK